MGRTMGVPEMTMLDARAVKERGGLNLCWGEWMKWQWKLGMWKRDESGKGDREGEGEGEEGERGEITNILTGVYQYSIRIAGPAPKPRRPPKKRILSSNPWSKNHIESRK